MAWVQDAAWFGAGPVVPQLGIGLGLDSGALKETLGACLTKRCDIYSMGLSLADASFWPNKTILKNLKAPGTLKVYIFSMD